MFKAEHTPINQQWTNRFILLKNAIFLYELLILKLTLQTHSNVLQHIWRNIILWIIFLFRKYDFYYNPMVYDYKYKSKLNTKWCPGVEVMSKHIKYFSLFWFFEKIKLLWSTYAIRYKIKLLTYIVSRIIINVKNLVCFSIVKMFGSWYWNGKEHIMNMVLIHWTLILNLWYSNRVNQMQCFEDDRKKTKIICPRFLKPSWIITTAMYF